jgi:hypothetical protein
MSLLLDRLEYGLIVDTAKRQKVNVEVFGPSVAIASGTVTTVSSVADQVRFGGMQAYRKVEALQDAAFNAGILANVTF